MAGIVDRAVLSYAQMPDSAKIAMLSEAISQLQSEMAVANSRIEEIDGDFPQQILMGGGDDSTATPASEYASYFKVYDASTTDVCKIGVQDGGNPSSGLCGVAVLNGIRIDVDKKNEIVGGNGAAWLVMAIGPEGETAEIVFTVPVREPEPTNIPIAYTAKLLGRFTVSETEPISITGINQDYLSGGEHIDFIFADCEEQVEQ